ncbi:MAG TPA: AP endonuclease, partial [Alphaproteobacteria bacterium]|nr:AP endonuclease [Alphaproteobacteria bacterium]
EGAVFIADHMIDQTDKAFDDFAGGARDDAQIKRMLGL